MPRLFPVVPNASSLGTGVIAFTPPAAPQILPDLSFDFKRDLEAQIGDIRTDTFVAETGIFYGVRVRQRREATIAQKCYATLATNRGWHRAHTRAYGINYERAMRRASFGLLVADIEQQITDQLMRIAGVAGVGDYVWRRNYERAWVRFVVRLSTGGRFHIAGLVPPYRPPAPPPEAEYPFMPGPPGPMGPIGPPGPRGSFWYVGHGVPLLAPAGSQPQDLYLDMDTGDVYEVLDDGTLRKR